MKSCQKSARKSSQKNPRGFQSHQSLSRKGLRLYRTWLKVEVVARSRKIHILYVGKFARPRRYRVTHVLQTLGLEIFASHDSRKFRQDTLRAQYIRLKSRSR